MTSKNIGLVLSGGGARGIAHLGALTALEEAGLKPNVISGVSSGAIIGALYSYGMSPMEILEILTTARLFRYIRPAWSKFGFLNIEKLESVYKEYLPAKTFEELKLKLIISSSDLQEGKTVFFSEGNLIQAILASSCMPLLFAPLKVDGKLMVDGGLMNNLPVEPLLEQCDFIIGVHVNPTSSEKDISSVKSMMERVFHLTVSMNVKERIKYCNIYIEPHELSHFSIFDISSAKEIYEIGYNHAQKVIKESTYIL